MNTRKCGSLFVGLILLAICPIVAVSADADYARAKFYSKLKVNESTTNPQRPWILARPALISTGYVPNERTVIRAKYHTNVDRASGVLFSAADGNSYDAPWMEWRMYDASLCYNTTETDQPRPTTGFHWMDLLLEVGNGGSKLTNINPGYGDAVIQTISGIDGSFSCSKGLWLFSKVVTSDDGATHAEDSGAQADVYYLTVSEKNLDGTETLLHEYVPCSVDGVARVADQVTKRVLVDQADVTALEVNEEDLIPDEAGLTVLTPHVVVGAPAEFEASLLMGGSPWTEGVSAVWDFGDGSEPVATATARATHAYSQAGQYSVTVTVTLGDRTAAKTFVDCVSADVDPSAVRFGTYKKVIRYSADGYAGTQTLTNFPVLVRLSEGHPTGFSYSDMKDPSSGAELFFADASLHGIPYEIDTWNPQGESLIWVKLPRVAKCETFFLYYAGQPRSSAKSDPKDVWSEYVGVWHMGEASGDCADATGNGFTAKPVGATENSIGVTGPVGVARQSATTEAEGYLDVGDYTSVYDGQLFTMSGWVKLSAPALNQVIFARRNSDTDGGWGFSVGWSDLNSFAVKGAANRAPLIYNGDLSGGEWAHVVLSYGNDVCHATINGAACGGDLQIYSVWGGQNLPLAFGCYSNGTKTYAPALFDELRLRKEKVSRDFAEAEYAAQASATFLSTSGAMDLKVPGLSVIVR